MYHSESIEIKLIYSKQPLGYLLHYPYRFRLGRMYRYQVERYDPESLTSFLTGFYKNYPAESIPLPKSPL